MKTHIAILPAHLWITLCIIFLFFCTACEDDNESSEPVPPDTSSEVMTTIDGVEFVRTPEASFENLPDWPYEMRYVEIDGLRQAYVDEGPSDANPILMLHGQPSWSYLYRHMIPTLVDAGHRVIVMDHLGMGASDKPIDLEYHSFDNHVSRLREFIDILDLNNITFFVQDWGSVIGLWAATEDLNRYARMIVGNGGIPNVEEVIPISTDIEGSITTYKQLYESIPDNQPPFFDEEGNPLIPVGDGGGSEAQIGFGEWMAFARHYEDWQVSVMMEALTYDALTEEEEVAYDAPFPTRTHMAAPRIFPSLINDLVGRTQPRRDALTTYERPFLTIFGGNDPGLGEGSDDQEWMINNIPGAEGQNHHRYPDASHFLQDDKGEDIANRVNQFIADNPI
ncbi:MAG: haloalkane dehalogenase [Bacteroidota bacterium]